MKCSHTNKVIFTVMGLFLTMGIVFGITGCGANDNSQESTSATNSPSTTSNSMTSEVVPSGSSSTEKESYAEDQIINQFIISYNATTENTLTDISKGNIKTKYYAYSFGYYLELLDSSDTGKITVTINETNDNANSGTAGMKDVFHDVIKAIDPSLSDDSVNSYFDKLIDKGTMVENDAFGNTKVTFVPDKDLSSGHSRGHIELAAQ